MTVVKKIVKPFVCCIKPIVGIEGPSEPPNIGKGTPFVDLRGFTLVELMGVLVVAGVLAALAAPSLSTFISNQRISSQANELLGDLNFARSEAVRRSLNVTVCKTSNPDAANPTCNGTAGDPWTAGRIVFVDDVKVGALGVRDAGDQVLRIRQVLDGTASTGNSLFGDTTVGDASIANFVSFGANGATTLGSESELVVCDKRGNSQAIAIAIAPMGRAHVITKGKNLNGANLAVCP
jgi:type IV fimbrial biogenesis protein FimT